MTSLLAFIIVMALTVMAFSGIGLISAAFIIVFKQGSPVNWVVSLGSGLLGGVFYPVSVLPGWLTPISALLPITHALEAMRHLLLNGASLLAVSDSILILTLFAAVLFPMGLLAFGYGLRIARREGSLIHY
jgi:ABC-2 type transport system permease protein